MFQRTLCFFGVLLLPFLHSAGGYMSLTSPFYMLDMTNDPFRRDSNGFPK